MSEEKKIKETVNEENDNKEKTNEEKINEKINEEKNSIENTNNTDKQLEELNNKYLRVVADFDNYRKRTRTEKEELVKFANKDLISELLPVLDNFQRALDVKSSSDEVKKFLTGMEMIYKQLVDILYQAGLEPINATGQVFDPEKHEAVMQVEDENMEDNTVIEELRVGYKFKDKIIRPSLVKVVKNNR